MVGQDPSAPPFKRQKINHGPVVTRYPPPGPVVTHYGPPPAQAVPWNGSAAQQQQLSQLSQQQQQQYGVQQGLFGQGFQQPQRMYGSQPYPVQGHYGQYGAQPAPFSYGAYGQALHAGPVPQAVFGQPHHPTIQPGYGYTVNQQPYPSQTIKYGVNGYGGPGVNHYGYPPHPQQVQYGQPQMQYPQQTQYGLPIYQVQQPQAMQVPAPMQQQPSGPVPQAQYMNQPAPQGPLVQQGPQALAHKPQTPRPSVPLFQHSKGKTHWYVHNPPMGPLILPAPPTLIEDDEEWEIEEERRKTLSTIPPSQRRLLGCDSPTPKLVLDDLEGFDIQWEEATFTSTKLEGPGLVAIATPITLVSDEFPSLYKEGHPAPRSKYVRPQNIEVFVLPIKKSLHWGEFQQDPALAPIDTNFPLVPRVLWDKFATERYHLRNTLSMSRESSMVRSHGDAHEGELSNDANGIDDSSCRHDSETPRTRGRSRTPALAVYSDGDAWAQQPGGRRGSTPVALASRAEARLTSLGVSGTPRPVSRSSYDDTYPPGFDSRRDSAYRQSRDATPRQESPHPPSRQDSGYASGCPASSGRRETDYEKHGKTRRGSHSSHTSPPQPPTEPRSYLDHGRFRGMNGYGSTPSQPSSRANSISTSVGPTPDESPLSPTSAALLGQIPMEENDKKRRRDEDHYARRKPQPKIDAAFR